MARRPPPPIGPEDPPTPREADALEGVRAPRETTRLFGRDAQIASFEAAWTQARPHHAWLLRGPRGVGKATFAHAAARRVLNPSDDPATATSLLNGGHPGLFELRRSINVKTGRPASAVSIDDVRRLISFFQLSAPDGGWRVAVVDPADELSLSAANALLKVLEEPPRQVLFFLVAHAAGRLPPTLRSRCRRLDFGALTPDDAAAAARAAAPGLAADAAETLAALAEGSPGDALRLHAAGGVSFYRAILTFLTTPEDAEARAPLIEKATSRDGAGGFDMVATLTPRALSRIVRWRYRSASEQNLLEQLIPAEGNAARRLAPNDAAARRLAEATSALAEKLRTAAALNLDPTRSILDIARYLTEQRMSADGGGQ